MTTAAKRIQAIDDARELLEALAGYTLYRGTTNLSPVSRATRRLARETLRSYPAPPEVERMGKSERCSGLVGCEAGRGRHAAECRARSTS